MFNVDAPNRYIIVLYVLDSQDVVPLDHVERVLSRVIPDLEGALRVLHG